MLVESATTRLGTPSSVASPVLKAGASAAALTAAMCSLLLVITVLKVVPPGGVVGTPVGVVTTEMRCTPMTRLLSARRLMVAASIWQVKGVGG